MPPKQVFSEMGAVTKDTECRPCGRLPESFCTVSLEQGLSLCFMCSDQHVKYWMPCGFSLISSFLLGTHIKQYTHFSAYNYVSGGKHTHFAVNLSTKLKIQPKLPLFVNEAIFLYTTLV